MTAEAEQDRKPESSLYAALSNAIVRLMRERRPWTDQGTNHDP